MLKNANTPLSLLHTHSTPGKETDTHRQNPTPHAAVSPNSSINDSRIPARSQPVSRSIWMSLRNVSICINPLREETSRNVRCSYTTRKKRSGLPVRNAKTGFHQCFLHFVLAIHAPRQMNITLHIICSLSKQ